MAESSTRSRRNDPNGDLDDLEPEGAVRDLDDDGLFDEDDDDMEGARSGYVTLDDLLGRVLIITPRKLIEREGDNGPYDAIECDVIVADGDTTDVMEEVPWKLDDFLFWGQNVVSTLRPALRRGKTIVGVLGQRRAKKYRTQAWVLDAPDDAQMRVAKDARAQIRQNERQAARR